MYHMCVEEASGGFRKYVFLFSFSIFQILKQQLKLLEFKFKIPKVCISFFISIFCTVHIQNSLAFKCQILICLLKLQFKILESKFKIAKLQFQISESQFKM